MAGRRAGRAGSRAPWTRGALAYAALAVACLAAYQPALHGGFLWDDDFYVSANPHLADLAGLKRLWTDTGAVPQYYPLTFTTFWIEHQIWGLDTTGYHVVNVLLHALSAFLLLHVLRRLEIPGGWLAAALFALHPVHVESVAWITERKNTLSGVFYLGAALAYLTFAADRRRRFGVLAVVLFLAALLSKSVTASLPAVLALVLVWREGRLDRRHVPWLGGMLLVGAAKGVLTAVLEVTQVGAQGAEWAIGPVERTLLAGRIVWFYLGKLAWPHPLAFVYERWPVDASAWWWWLFPLAAVALVAALAWFRGRIGSGPLVAVLFFGITISPALGFLNVYPMRYSWVADHFQYLASLGPTVLFAAGWVALRNRLGTGFWRAATAVILVALAGLSWRQAHDYRDLETLWRSTMAKSPRAWMPPYNLGKIVRARGASDEALALYRRALELKPDHVDAHTEIANVLLDRGDTGGAIAQYEKGLAIDPGNAIGHFNLGIALEAAGDPARAEAAYREAIRQAPSLEGRYRGGRGPLPWRAHLNLARVLERAGRHDEALAEYERSAAANPDAAEPLVDLGSLLAEAGRLDEAAAAFRRAAAVPPGSAAAQYNLATVLSRRGDRAGAIASYRAALRLDERLAPAWNGLAIALYEAGDFEGARQAAGRSARLGLPPHPDFARALESQRPGAAR